MAKPNPTHPVHSVSEADLSKALERIGAEIAHQPLRGTMPD